MKKDSLSGQPSAEAELSGYKEKASHGDILMPVQRYRNDIRRASYTLSLHWHEEVELGWLTEGAAEYDIDFVTYPVKKGDLLLISPHTLRAARVAGGGRMISDSLVFHLNMLGYSVPDACSIRYLGPLQNGKYRFMPVIRSGQAGHEELQECLKELLGCVEDKNRTLSGQEEGRAAMRWEGKELYMKELLFRFFRLLYQHGYVVKKESSALDPNAEEKLKTVLSYIREHYAERLTIEELAGLCHFSQPYFMSFFKKCVGMTCVEYINQCRLSRAAEALATTDAPVMDAALENGFRNLSYFNKLFRREFGKTPREYRREAKKR